MVDEGAVRGRLNELRETRLAAMRGQARRQAAMEILDEQGSVSVDEIDQRVAATFAEPSEEALRNLLAQKTLASVEFEERQLDHLRDARARAEDKVAKFQTLLEDAQGAVARLDEQIADQEAAVTAARQLAEFAAPEGDASAAPPPSNVNAAAQVAEADATARGTDDDVEATPPERDVVTGNGG